MTAAKELKRMVSPVIVNVKTEMGKLPEEIAAAQKKVAGAYPYIILADPALSKIYGAYGHAQLKGQDYRKIFREAKRAASADIKEKTFNMDLGDSKKADDSQDDNTEVAEKSTPATSEEKPAPVAKKSNKDIIKIDNPKMKSWKSSRGSTIEAKLIGVEDKKTFVLVTSAGKTIRVTGDKLSLASLNEARELAGLD